MVGRRRVTLARRAPRAVAQVSEQSVAGAEESAASWEEWEKLSVDQGEVVKVLKGGGADKDAVTAAVGELLHRCELIGTGVGTIVGAAGGNRCMENDDQQTMEQERKAGDPSRWSIHPQPSECTSCGGMA